VASRVPIFFEHSHNFVVGVAIQRTQLLCVKMNRAAGKLIKPTFVLFKGVATNHGRSLAEQRRELL
jgi:hypothetical protein